MARRYEEGKVVLCYKNDAQFEHIVRFAEEQGQTVYLDEETNEVYILRDTSKVWHAPNIEFKYTPSGLYTFEKDGSIKYSK